MWKTLQAVKALESKIGELYHCFADVFKHDTEAAALFSRLARDEEKHCSIIEFEIRLIMKDNDLALPVAVDQARIEREQQKVGDLLRCTGLSLAEAVAASFTLEQTATESYYRSAAVKEHPDLMGLVKRLGAGDRSHYNSLVRFGAARGFAPPPAWPFEQEL